MPGSNFDYLESSMMDVVTNLFGYSASWTPSGGGDTITGMVLFKAPAKTQDVQAVGFSGDLYYSMEYKKSEFPGLLEAVANTRKTETITIDGISYRCRFPKPKYDGDTVVVTLELPE